MKTLTFDGVGRIHIPKEIRKLILGVEDTEGMALNLYLYGNRIIMEVPGDHEKPEVEWSKVQVDTPILVKEFKEEKWHKRYFAKYEDGKVYTWYKGATSWSTDNSGLVTDWETAKLAEQEERIEKSDTEKEQLELAECVSKIRTYCLSRNECEGCMFRKDEGFFVNCAIDNNPSKWEVQRGRI